MATDNVPAGPAWDWDNTWEVIDTCMLQALGIVELINVSGNPSQNAAWAVEGLLTRARELHESLREQVIAARSEAAHV